MTPRPARICLFCGRPPENKNNEHPLPRWLLELTGDPARVVFHGYNWRTGKQFEFSFDSFKFPSCGACNESYSRLEGDAKRAVAAICKKEALNPDDYVLLLDWLDKVRIGLWLGHRYLQGASWPPSFTIDSRIGAKDRMVAVYPIGDHQTGLNVYGAECRLFHWKPSVFSLRINNVLLLNASWDWMCSSRCGFPYPKVVRHSKAVQGALVVRDFRQRRSIVHPVLGGLMKSCVTLFQPIVQRHIDGTFGGMPHDMVADCAVNQWHDRVGIGPLFRQLNGETRRIDPDSPAIEFDSVLAHEARRAIDIATQAYSLQNDSIENDTYIYDDGTQMSDRERLMLTLARINTKTMKTLRRMPPEKYAQIMREATARRAKGNKKN
jgi:hypothetical protein